MYNRLKFEIDNTTKKSSYTPADTGMPFWGSYRPGFYFGLKSKYLSKSKVSQYYPSLVSGIMWTENIQSREFRHRTNQDELTNFEWTFHDGMNFGEEILTDNQYGLLINASFYVHPINTTQPSHIQPTWCQRIHMKVNSKENLNLKTLLFYFGVECDDQTQMKQCLDENSFQDLQIISHSVSNGYYEKQLTLIGNSVSTGYFSIFIGIKNSQPSSLSSEAVSVSYTGIPRVDSKLGIEKIMKETKNIFQNQHETSEFQQFGRRKLKESSRLFTENGELNDEIPLDSSFVAFCATFRNSFDMDIVFFEHKDVQRIDQLIALNDLSPVSFFTPLIEPVSIIETTLPIDEMITLPTQETTLSSPSSTHTLHQYLDHTWRSYKRNFTTKFQSIFSLQDDALLNTTDSIDSLITSSRNILSSLLGGIGFFSGTPKIGIPYEDESEEIMNKQRDPHTKLSKISSKKIISLLTATPSRTAFPRGFLWDEGFHQLLILHWDSRITISILSHWFNAMFQSDDFQYESSDHHVSSDGDEDEKSSGGAGWIPREMILGDEASSRVPDEFITQRMNIANPPTLLLAIEQLIDRLPHRYRSSSGHQPDTECKQLDQESQLILDFLQQEFENISKWVQCFLHSQKGHEEGSFRWRGRSIYDRKIIPNTLSSGLDDYPRSPLPSIDEHHVDLHCWMIKACDIMNKMEEVVRIYSQTKLIDDHCLNSDNPTTPQTDKLMVASSKYRETYQFLLDQLDKLHWSDEHTGYFDVGLNDNDGKFLVEVLYRCGVSNQPTHPNAMESNQFKDLFVSVDVLQQRESFCPSSHPHPLYPIGDGRGGYNVRERYGCREQYTKLQHLPHIGYVSLFPFLLKIIPMDSRKLVYILYQIEDPDLLWTNYGIRSISKSDLFYQRKNSAHDDPYWRGPIWININYLILSALKYYEIQLTNELSEEAGDRKDLTLLNRIKNIYTKLRQNIIRNMFHEYITTGFIWEQYDDATGKGIKGHPFTGWSALFVNILYEKY